MCEFCVYFSFSLFFFSFKQFGNSNKSDIPYKIQLSASTSICKKKYNIWNKLFDWLLLQLKNWVVVVWKLKSNEIVWNYCHHHQIKAEQIKTFDTIAGRNNYDRSAVKTVTSS